MSYYDDLLERGYRGRLPPRDQIVVETDDFVGFTNGMYVHASREFLWRQPERELTFAEKIFGDSNAQSLE